MRRIGRKAAAVAATGVLLGALAACGSGGSGGAAAKAGEERAKASATGSAPAPAPPATGTAPASPAASGGAGSGAAGGTGAGGGSGSGGGTGGGAGTPQVWQDAETPLLDYRAVLALMPDGAALPGWEQEKRRVDPTDHSVDCDKPAACNGKPLSGEARFTSADTTARFLVDTLPGKAAAQAKLKEAYAAFGDSRYRAVELTVIGTESRAWQGQSGGRDGVSIVMRAGTVVATVSTEEGPVDPALTQRLATMLAKRIEQAQAGRTPDTPLGS